MSEHDFLINKLLAYSKGKIPEEEIKIEEEYGNQTDVFYIRK